MSAKTLYLSASVLWIAFGQAPPPPGGGLHPALPANLFTASSTLAHTTLKHEWMDIPMGSGKISTWIEYPAGEAKAPVVLLMHYDAGLDDLQRAIADQLATDGFIVIEPDLLSGLGPRGGNYDSFAYPDEALRAVAKISRAEAMKRYKIAYEYAMKLPVQVARPQASEVESEGQTVFGLPPRSRA